MADNRPSVPVSRPARLSKAGSTAACPVEKDGTSSVGSTCTEPGEQRLATLVLEHLSDVAEQLQNQLRRQEEMLSRLLQQSPQAAVECSASSGVPDKMTMHVEATTSEVYELFTESSVAHQSSVTSKASHRSLAADREKRRSKLRRTATQIENERLQIARRMSGSSASVITVDDLRGSGWRRRVGWFVNRKEFDLFIFTMIAINVVMVGIEVDMAAALPANRIPAIFAYLNLVFAVVFSTEMLLKIIGNGFKNFFCGPDRPWNIFDCVIVFFSLVEVVLDAWQALLTEAMSMNHLRVFRVLRLARIFRGIRIIRILRFVGSLRTLLHSIANTLKSLVWTVVLLCLIFYGFGVALTQATVDHCRGLAIQASGDHNAHPLCDNPVLNKHWSSLPDSMYTLFMSTSGGVTWGDVAEPLSQISGVVVFTYLAFIAFIYFAVLNVVTGVFCHTAIESANADKDMAVMMQMANKSSYVHAMNQLFHELDEDDSQAITLDEFERKLGDETMAAYLESIDLEPSDAWQLFRLIDGDMSGCINIEEFVTGCLQLKGNAKAIQIAKLNYEARITRHTLRGVEDSVASIQARVDTLVKLLVRHKATEERIIC